MFEEATQRAPRGPFLFKYFERERKAPPAGFASIPHDALIYTCVICGGPGGSRHHLIPKSVRDKYLTLQQNADLHATIRTCPRCHGDIHFYFSNWELALKFNTEEALRIELRERKNQKL